MSEFTLHHGDCLARLKELPDNSVDSVVTDPPYGLSFMGKKWDYDVPATEVWAECLRVLKPGGHLLAFAGTRTQHRMAVRIEDAGFEIRDMIAWVYGSGFPKSLDVSKAIDKAAGAEREETGRILSVTGNRKNASPAMAQSGLGSVGVGQQVHKETTPATEAAPQWQGWGTALKPALEPITVARKPLGSTVAECVLAHGTGALNIDGCRVAAPEGRPLIVGDYKQTENNSYQGRMDGSLQGGSRNDGKTTQGRWPANLILSDDPEVLAGFPNSKGTANGGKSERNSKNSEAYWGEGGGGFKGGRSTVAHADIGSAARFFYCAKASKRDRDEGLDNMPTREVHRYGSGLGEGNNRNAPALNKNIHPTVKPTDLMRYLCRLVTQPGGVVLDPFMGSGSTGKAALLEGFQFIGIEREAEYLEIARARIAAAQPAPTNDNTDLFGDVA